VGRPLAPKAASRIRLSAQVALMLAGSLLVGSVADGQTSAPPRARPRTASAKITVRDNSGTPLGDVQIGISGSGSRSVTTDANGVASTMLDAGTYRMRFDRAGFITLERDVTIQSGRPAEIEVALDLAPPPPTPPAPPPPLPPPKEAVPAAGATNSAGPPVVLSVPTFLDKNYLGRDPLRESILGCTPSGVTRLLQLRDPVALHTHANVDEVLYVIAGEGAVRLRDESSAITAGSLSVIPRGVPHAIERRGKNPLILLSTLSGAPCAAVHPTDRD